MPGIRFARQEGRLPEETLHPARSTGLSSPSPPPLLTGSDNSSRSLAVHVWPVIDGIRASLIARPNGSSSSSISDNHERTQRVFTISFVGT